MKIQIPITTIVGAKITLSTLLLCIPISSVAELNVKNNEKSIKKSGNNQYKPDTTSNNNITVSGKEPTGAAIYGGYSNESSTETNTVTIDANVLIGHFRDVRVQKYGTEIIGGKGTSALGNKVIVKNSNDQFTYTELVGGFNYTHIVGGEAISGKSANNTVLLNNKFRLFGGVDAYASTYIYGGYSTVETDGNKVEINNGLSFFAMGIYQYSLGLIGGLTYARQKGINRSSNNTVDIKNSNLKAQLVLPSRKKNEINIIGGQAEIHGGSNVGRAESINNKVNLTNVNISADNDVGNFYLKIYGGKSNFNATSNIISIKGTNINTANNPKAAINIYGGYAAETSDQNKISITDNSNMKVVQIFGGDSVELAKRNILEISKSKVTATNIYGGHANTNANNNSIKISEDKTTITATNIYGGHANTNANNNKIEISGGNVSAKYIYGGKSSNSEGNNIIISGGTINVTGNNTIYGGHATTNANNNKIEISGGTINNSNKNNIIIIGGNANNMANSNTVSITQSTVEKIIGGNSGMSASKNSVIVSGGSVNTSIVGGQAYGGLASKNSVTVSTDTSAIVIGGQNINTANATNNNATENSVTISSGTITNNIYGGKSITGSADKNSVTISGGTISKEIYGGHGTTVSKNSVIISGDNTSINNVIYGGYSDKQNSNATENSVTISGGTISKEIYGGHGTTVSKNSVIISGDNTSINNVIYGGYSDKQNSNATENSVTISGGTITGNVYGGYAKEARDNIVAISGGTITGNVYGGYSSDSHTSSGNKIIISGSPDLSNATLYGADGKIAAPPPIAEQNLEPKRVRRALLDPVDIQPLNNPPSDYKSNNTLSTHDLLNLNIQSIKNFSNLNLDIPRNMTTKDHILILGEDMDLSDLIITPQFNVNNLNLNAGDTITLIGGFNDAKITGGDDTNFITPIPKLAPQPVPVPVVPVPVPVVPVPVPVVPVPVPVVPVPVVPVSEPKKALFGVSQIITYTSVGNGKFVLGKKEPNPGMKSFLESGVASIVSTNQAGDLASNEGIKNMVSQASSSNSFAALSNGRFRYKTGSHVDINGFSLIVGISKKTESFTYGIFMEAGNANYNSYNDFATNSIPNTNSIKGSGDTNYFGIGVLLNTKLANNFYLDGSLRGGKVKSNYVSNDFNGLASFDMGRNYFGGHIGLGRIFNINDINIIDLYSKILYSEQGSKTVHIRDEGFEFDTAKSIRLNLGARYNYELNDSTSLYGGAAYEREFDGKQKTYSIVANANIDAPGASGDSAMFEIGANITPTNYKEFNANFNLQLFTGVKSGISGGLKAQYKF
ncbi:autotransporter outer membrane beta-barrel domain-containing protein [Campylobacter fetus]|uniref:autotransporter outer membrane beta-barrel domain-containing protein n=1 Tax=Campylobacter fetus TaxID=196 RepID=UPI000FCC5958|nr:autotransporter outer membrane beta-barrel domain-containing protein [Campylobacter fetus]RUT48865.1 hypothetical protein BWK67_08985 [Campylobacter fetus]RUT48987.1 hypothetical protein BWK51_08960 [Campylobacter fetus]